MPSPDAPGRRVRSTLCFPFKVKRLLLLRHAKASSSHPGLTDRDRPLTNRGRRDAQAIGERLQRDGVVPELVLCSPAKRTRETLEGVVAALGDRTEVRFDRRIYAASEAELLAVLREVEDGVGTVLMIGHNPGTHRLAVTLAGGGPEIERLCAKFPTAALARLEFAGPWRVLAAASADLVSFVAPGELA